MVRIAGVTISNADRVLYAEQGITKGALAAYYDAVAGVMLPHVAGRPLVVVRCPQGRHKTCFYQKHWTSAVPASIDTVDIRETSGKVQPYAVVRDAAGLVSLVQHGVLEVHVWGARSDDLEAPDRLVFDLDPGPGVGWQVVVAAAVELKQRLASLGLASWVKTTGGKGLHIVIPLVRRSSWDDVSGFARAVAEAMVADSPGRYIAQASKAARAGLIFVDWLRNARGATAVAPWSTRSRMGAPIAVPVSWDDLDRVERADQYTVVNVSELIGGAWRDPWADLPGLAQRLSKSVVSRAARAG